MQNKNLLAIQEYVREICDLECDYFEYCCEDDGGDHCEKCGSSRRRHHALTLARVLSGRRGDNCLVWQDNKLYFKFDESGNIFEWQLLNGDGTDCTFEQQSEETQLAVAKLLGYEPTNTAESVENN